MTIARIVRHQRIAANHIDWEQVPDFEESAGAVDIDVSQYVTDRLGHSLSYSIAPSSPSDEADLTAAGLALDPDTGHIEGTYDGETELSVVVRATDNDAAADWLLRSGQDAANPQPDVVWFHNFESDAEVDNFRFILGDGGGTQPSDPGSDVRRVNDGFAGGGYLEINVPQGVHQHKDWRRPFSPLLSPGNGRATDDPGASGAITRRTYDPSDDNEYNWTQGWWGHEDYTGQGQFDGTTKFYVQARMRISAGRFAGNNPEQGKLVYIDAAPGLNQELIITSRRDGRYEMYTSFGSAPNSFLSDPQNQEATGARQPGGPYDASCRYDDFVTCWLWAPDEWVTVLFAVTPGRHWSSGTIAQAIADPSMANTGIEIWMAREGETSYTKIWEKFDYVWSFETVFGWNMFKASAYHNGVTAGTAFTHHYRQIIFSRAFIPCPQA